MTPVEERGPGASTPISGPRERAGAAGGGAEARLPRRFGQYQLFDRLGKGGMATIYLVRVEAGLGDDRPGGHRGPDPQGEVLHHSSVKTRVRPRARDRRFKMGDKLGNPLLGF